MNTSSPIDAAATSSGRAGRSLMNPDDLIVPSDLVTAARNGHRPVDDTSPVHRGAEQRPAKRPAAAAPKTGSDADEPRASRGSPRLTQARLAIAKALMERLDGQRVPELLLTLANPGWRSVLLYAHLHHGPDHDAWHDALAVFDAVHAALQHAATGQRVAGADRLVRRVADGLSDVCFEAGQRRLLLDRLAAALGCGAPTPAPIRLVDVPAGSTPCALGLIAEPAPEPSPGVVWLDPAAADVRHSWSLALDRASRLVSGDRLIGVDPQGRPQLLAVAVPGDATSPFAFADATGDVVARMTVTELADALHTGRLALFDDAIPADADGRGLLQQVSRQLAWQSRHDALTGLLNRSEFERCLAEAMKSACGPARHALLYIDIDQFKVVNTTSGHAAGDALLKAIAARLARGLAVAQPTVARLGGDEFGVLIEDIDADGAQLAADLALSLIRREQFEWAGQHHAVTASVGLVLLDPSIDDADTAMRYADSACYAAKETGRNRVLEHELGDRRIMRRQTVMAWVAHLDRAMAENRLALNCQRIVPLLSSGALPYHEVLLTLDEELGELMPAGEFIRAAESYHRVTALDRWVVRRVLQWMADHRSALDRMAGLAINISGHSVNDETFGRFVLDQFAATRIPTAKVCFEITESAAIANLENARAFMNRIRLIGCRFALDDFGTGLASYAYLRNLPVDFVKIDGIFVRGMERDAGDRAVVRSITEIGHSMGKQIIAEYVENDAVLTKLRSYGVDYAQGYGIERPCALDALTGDRPGR